MEVWNRVCLFLEKKINILLILPFEEGSVTNMLTSIVVNVFGFKALRAPILSSRVINSYSIL